MREDIINLKNNAIGQIMDTDSDKELEELRIEYLGRNGKINEFLIDLKKLKPDERKDVGILINESKIFFSVHFDLANVNPYITGEKRVPFG